MSETLTLPFTIGQTLWAPRTHGEKVRVTCPACLGLGVIEFKYGDGVEAMRCDACACGYDGPRGYIEEYDFSPNVTEFVVADVESMHSGRWSLRATTGAVEYFETLCATEAEALAESVRRCAEQEERNMQSRQHKRNGKAKATWSAMYHKNQIKDLERQIAWHKSRLSPSKLTDAPEAGR